MLAVHAEPHLQGLPSQVWGCHPHCRVTVFGECVQEACCQGVESSSCSHEWPNKLGEHDPQVSVGLVGPQGSHDGHP